MGGSTETGSSTSQSASPVVRSTVDKLAGGVASAYSPGKSLYQAPGANTTGSWEASLAAANNPAFTGGLSGALQSYGNRAAGGELGINDPLYAQQRARLTDDVLTSTNSAFNSSGLFGSDQNQQAAGRGLAEALGGLDLSQRTESYGRQAEAAGMLPGLYSALQMPSAIQGSVGSAQDAAATAKANGETDYLAKLTSILSGNAASAGTTSTESKPLWRELFGIGVSAL